MVEKGIKCDKMRIDITHQVNYPVENCVAWGSLYKTSSKIPF
jgi:hypothetical protein